VNMNSERNLTQHFIEQYLGYSGINDWSSYKGKLQTTIFNETEIIELKKICFDDAKSYFNKGIISLYYALNNLYNNQFSWATVEFYYSLFYFLRTEILLSEHILLRCNSLFYYKLKKNSKFVKYSPSNLRGDHQLTISFQKHLYDQRIIVDPLLDNDLNSLSVYLWYLDQRERINYRKKYFSDPDILDIYNETVDYIKNISTNNFIKDLFNSTDYLFCFDEMFAAVSIPITKAKLVKEKIFLFDNEYKIDIKIRDFLNNINSNLMSSDLKWFFE